MAKVFEATKMRSCVPIVACGSNQNASVCQTVFKYFLNRPSIDWTCPLCSLPPLSDSFFDELHDLLMVHLNINSCQNKLDELIFINKELKSHVIFLSETKIDSSYPNAQMNLVGYNIYRKDRKKGGGGLMAYFSTKMVSRQVKNKKQYKLIEVLAIKAMVSNNDMLFIAIYRPPNANGSEYYTKLEEELNSVCMWATMECNTLVLTGDFNLDRLRPEHKERQIVLNLEEVYGLECQIKDPTRVTPASATLLDVILTNKPD